MNDMMIMETKKEKSEGPCNASCLKTLLMMFNFLYWMAGLSLMVVGVWTLIYKKEYEILMESNQYQIIVGLMIGTGSLILLIFGCGCFGVIRENRYVLMIYCVMVTLILVVQLSIGIVAFVHHQEIEDEIHRVSRNKMNEYGVLRDVTRGFDILHQKHKCCGDSNYFSWNATAWRQSDMSVNNSVPDSCCKTVSKYCGKRHHPSNVYHEGCLTKLHKFFVNHIYLLGGIIIGLSIFQVIGIGMSIALLRFVDSY